MFNSLRPHELQYVRLPCPSLSPEFAQIHAIESVMPSNHLILCHHLLLLPSVFTSISVFSSDSALRIRGPKYWSFGFSISPSSEYSGMISFSMDWFDLRAVQGTLESLFQHYTSKALILWCSAFFTVQLSHSYVTTGKTMALTIQTFVIYHFSYLLYMYTWIPACIYTHTHSYTYMWELYGKN